MGFGSRDNYFIGNRGAPLDSPTVTILVLENIVLAESWLRPQPQWPFVCSFQINGYSSEFGTLAWQQYVFTFSSTLDSATLATFVELWPSQHYINENHLSQTADLFNTGSASNSGLTKSVGLAQPALPAGYWMQVTILTDQNGFVTGVKFLAYNSSDYDNPIELLNNTVMLDQLTTEEGQPYSQAMASPVVALQVNVIGSNSGKAVFSSGSGSIAYMAGSELTAYPSQPAWSGYQGNDSKEGANTVYDALPANSMYSLVHNFSVVKYQPGQALAAVRQFGSNNQTDVFMVGSTGQLGMVSVQGSGNWSSHPPVGPIGFPPNENAFAPAGACLAASQIFGSPTFTGVFLVDNTGAVNGFYYDSSSSDGWLGPTPISEPGFAPPGAQLAVAQRAANAVQTDLYVVDSAGQLQVFSFGYYGPWTGPVAISAKGFAPPGAGVAASARYGVPNQTDVYVAQTSGAMNVFSVVGDGPWTGPTVISQPGFEAPPWANIWAGPRPGVANQVDVYVCDHHGQLTVFSLLQPLVPIIFGNPAWQTTPIGPSGFAPNGARIAVSPQFGISGQIDVFVVDQGGNLQVFWAEGDGGWGGPQLLGNLENGLEVPPGSFITAVQKFGAASPQTDVLLIGRPAPPPQPELGWPTVFTVVGNGAWSGPKLVLLQV